MGHRIVEHTADLGIEAWGADLAEAFAETARGMFSAMVDIDTIVERVERTQSIHAIDREGLLVTWLNELLAVVDSEGLVFRRFVIGPLLDHDLVARSYGEPIDPARHAPHMALKAATYHGIVVDPGPPARTRVVVDV